MVERVFDLITDLRIQEWLGHCSPTTTTIYAHLTAQSAQASAQAVNRLMADVAIPI